jgi:hypothetical protein
MIWLKARMWAALSALGAILAVVGVVYGKGRSDARKSAQVREQRDYINERKKIDAEIGSVGSTDSERVKRLRDIADRRGTGKD